MIFVCEKCDGDECMGKEICEKAHRAEKTPASYGSVSTSQMVCIMQPPIKSHTLAVLMWQFLFPSPHKSLWHPIKSNSITSPSQKKINNNMPGWRKKMTHPCSAISFWMKTCVGSGTLCRRLGREVWPLMRGKRGRRRRGGEGRGGGGEGRRGDDYGHGPAF